MGWNAADIRVPKSRYAVEGRVRRSFHMVSTEGGTKGQELVSVADQATEGVKLVKLREPMTDSKRKDTPATADLAGLRHNSRLTITRLWIPQHLWW